MTDIVKAIQETFNKKTVVILGDLVADQFLNGTISRVSREAPVFILRHDATETRPGGAANAAVNVASLAARPVLVGLTGQDANSELLFSMLDRAGVEHDFVLSDSSLSTTTKIRVLAGQHYAARQQVIRIDYENKAEIPTEIKQKLQENLTTASETADAIIVSDYGYGVVFPEIFESARLIAAERRIPLLIDSRFRLVDFPNASTATPNMEEVELVLGKDFSARDCSQLRERLGLKALLVTNGNKGMTLFEKNKPPFEIEAVGAAEPVDVTGAGDTVIAVYALGLASGLSYSDAARIANHAGGIVVMKKGTASVNAVELLESINAETEILVSEHAN